MFKAIKDIIYAMLVYESRGTMFLLGMIWALISYMFLDYSRNFNFWINISAIILWFYVSVKLSYKLFPKYVQWEKEVN